MKIVNIDLIINIIIVCIEIGMYNGNKIDYIDTDATKMNNKETSFIFEKNSDNPTFFETHFNADDYDINNQININNLHKVLVRQKVLNISLMIHLEKRPIYNIYEWYLGQTGFVNATRSKYALITKVSVVLERKCLISMLKFMDTSPKCAVCTGSAHLASENTKNNDKKSCNLKAAIMRNIHVCELNVINNVFNPLFSCLGFLPVVTDDCVLFRCLDNDKKDRITANNGKDHRFDWYFDAKNYDTSYFAEPSFLFGHFGACDAKTLSYISVLKQKKPFVMRMVRNAVYYCDFEADDLNQYLSERSKLFNSTFFGVFYLLFAACEHFWRWNVSCIRKSIIWFFLVLLQLNMFFLFFCWNSVSMIALYQSLEFFKSKIDLNFDNYVDFVSYENGSIVLHAILALLWIIWMLGIILHNKKYAQMSSVFFYFGCAVSLLTSIITLTALIWKMMDLFDDNYENVGLKPILMDTTSKIAGFDTITTISVAIAALLVIIIVFFIFCSFFVSCGRRTKGSCCSGLYRFITSCFTYFMLFHFVFSWISSFVIAKCWNVSWNDCNDLKSTVINITEPIGQSLDAVEEEEEAGASAQAGPGAGALPVASNSSTTLWSLRPGLTLKPSLTQSSTQQSISEGTIDTSDTRADSASSMKVVLKQLDEVASPSKININIGLYLQHSRVICFLLIVLNIGIYCGPLSYQLWFILCLFGVCSLFVVISCVVGLFECLVECLVGLFHKCSIVAEKCCCCCVECAPICSWFCGILTIVGCFAVVIVILIFIALWLLL